MKIRTFVDYRLDLFPDVVVIMFTSDHWHNVTSVLAFYMHDLVLKLGLFGFQAGSDFLPVIVLEDLLLHGEEVVME